MFESNFPVDKLSCSYTVLWNSFKRLTRGYSADGQGQALPRHRRARLPARGMSLSLDEFRAHLELSTATAGIALPRSCCPTSTTCCSGACAFTTSTGARRAAARALPARRRPQRPYLGPGLRRAAPRAALRRPRPARPRRERVVAGDGLRHREPRADIDAFVDALEPLALRAGRHVAGRHERARLGRAPQPAAGRAGRRRHRARDPRRGRPQDARSPRRPRRSIGRPVRGARAGLQPAPQPELLRRSLLHNLRRMPDGRWIWKYDQRHRGRRSIPPSSGAAASCSGRRWTA